MRTLAGLVLVAACGGRLDAESAAAMQAQPNPCGAPTFEPGACEDETLNDGGGPDDHRRVCRAGDVEWVLYPSGEQWELRPRDGSTPEALCHGLPDGSVWRAP